MKATQATLFFLAVVPMLAHAQAPMPSDGGTQTATAAAQPSQRADQASHAAMHRWHDNGDCVGPNSFCNLFAGS
ncbi:hypothetical protein [Paraburkholderia acidisoli]|uniref:Uncharacterized protein n=1 Tax=Paraburkholderia acidisoli TaxID=2571748 RepID=A0A7Z2GJR6_9BURK|nr:hypothetical protein [Paraburkholderia acidisoli]QGZ63102.1 hypothetical protein FAZ98_14875 [Paraburkholderia acidisoli]